MVVMEPDHERGKSDWERERGRDEPGAKKPGVSQETRKPRDWQSLEYGADVRLESLWQVLAMLRLVDSVHLDVSNRSFS